MAEPQSPALLVSEGARVVAAAPARRTSLRGPRIVAHPANQALGLGLPEKPLTSIARAGLRLCWLGPDEWLILDETHEAEARANAVSAALIGLPHGLVDVSHRQLGFIVSGEKAALVLNSGCPLDLHDSAFPLDAVTRTLFHKAEILLIREGAQSFRLECGRSFAPYVLAHLNEAMLRLADVPA
jgi:sarcosine oxidase, subunit gamma